MTRDGGQKWDNVIDKVGLAGPRWVASIEPSRFVEGRAYVCFDAHRSDDEEPYLFVTEDFGATWKSIRGNLPTGSSRVLREDLENKNVLYCGTEFAVWVSIDGGKVWSRLNSNLPTVAVHELAQHPSGEMVAATHGRSLWILDVTPIRQMKTESLKASATLYRPATVTRWRPEPQRLTLYGDGSRRFIGENPPSGAAIFYSLNQKAEKVNLRIVDFTGTPVRYLEVKNTPGLHQARWDLRRTEGLLGTVIGRLAPKLPAPTSALAGMYRVVLAVDGKEYTQPLRLQNDPTVPATTVLADPPPEPARTRTWDTRLDD